MMIDFDIGGSFQPLLMPGEKVVWTGRPRQGLLLRSSDFFVIPFSLLWLGFVSFWEFAAGSMGAPVFFKLFGIPFVLVGLYLAVGRFWADARSRANTVYAITNHRIFIQSGLFRREIRALDIHALADVTFSQRKDGSGSITLGAASHDRAPVRSAEWRNPAKPPQLELIDDVSAVYQEIMRLQQRNRQR